MIPPKVITQPCLFLLYIWFPLVECGQYLIVIVPGLVALATAASVYGQAPSPSLEVCTDFPREGASTNV